MTGRLPAHYRSVIESAAKGRLLPSEPAVLVQGADMLES